ncbi:MAG: 1-acyl-sn-glycerol-3-phosphate acyltransferase [Chitinophagales bacterium]|nr:1-acyl-sn-glycerol-3-phosphate acyltransferase [Sphingobacteriales bacterium]
MQKLKKPLEYVNPDYENWGIYKLDKDKDAFLIDVVERIIEKSRKNYPTTRALFDELASTLYQERIRVTTSRWKSDPDDEKDFWNNVKGQIIKFQKAQNWEDADRAVLETLLKKILYRYAYEIVANFKPRIFDLAQRFLPRILFLFLNSKLNSPFKFLFRKMNSFYEKFVITGDFDLIRNLSKKGTIVVVPTHFSNTDSPLVGWTLNSIGLEPVTYGAGINLVGTQPLSFMLNNLGAYKLDRRRKNALYLELLKSYSQMAIERDTPSLFFPGGTRSRSGAIESKLKLGLLSTAVEAQQENFIHHRKKIFVLPIVINYQYNIESSSLINQYLVEVGKEKYVSDSFEYSTTYKIVRFIKHLFNADTGVVISFGKPLDVIGNEVNENGESIAPNGKPFDIKGYFEIENKIVRDEQRNYEYTKILGDKIVKSYFKYNTVMTSPLIAFSYFLLLKRRHKHLSLFEIMLLPKEDRIIKRERILEVISLLKVRLMELCQEDKVNISDFILENSAEAILVNGIDSISLFNSKKVVYADSDGNINSQDVKLAYFYHNRLIGYNLEQYI